MLRASDIAKLKSDDCDLYKEEGKARVSYGGIMPYSSFIGTLSRILAGRIREANEKVAKALLADLSKGFDSDLYKKAKGIVDSCSKSWYVPSLASSSDSERKDILAHIMEQIVIYTSYVNCFILRYTDVMSDIDLKRKAVENSFDFVENAHNFRFSPRLIISNAMDYMWDTIIPNVDFSVEDMYGRPNGSLSVASDIFVPIGRGEVGGRAMVYDKPTFNDDGSIQVCPKGMETSYHTASRLMNVNVGFDSNGDMLRCLKLLMEAIKHLVKEKNAYIYVPNFKSDASKIDNMTYEELVSFFDLENGMQDRKGLSRDTLDSLDGYLDSFKAKEHLTREDLLKYVKLIHEGASNDYGLFSITLRKPCISEPLYSSVTTANTENYTSYKVRVSTHLWDVETEKCRLTPIYVKRYSLGWWNVSDGNIFRRLSDSIKVFNQSDINQFRLRVEGGIEKLLGKAGDSSFVELLDDVYGLNLGNYKRYMDFIGFALFQLKHQCSAIGSYKLRASNNLTILGAHVPMVSYFDFS
jgi:hypothetical protein